MGKPKPRVMFWQDMPWFGVLDASTQPYVAAALGVNMSGMKCVI
jgi:hypothetical protein